MTPTIDQLINFGFINVHTPNEGGKVYEKDGVKLSVGYFDCTVQLFDGSVFFRGMFESEEQIIEVLSNAMRKAESLNNQLKAEAENKYKKIKGRAAS